MVSLFGQQALDFAGLGAVVLGAGVRPKACGSHDGRQGKAQHDQGGQCKQRNEEEVGKHGPYITHPDVGRECGLVHAIP